MTKSGITLIKTLTVILTVGCAVLYTHNTAYAGDRVVTLKQSSSPDDDYIRVGHIFENAGDVAARPLAPVPETGKHLTLNEADIARVAKAFNLSWTPSLDKPASITFTRNSSRISLDTIKKVLAESELAASVGNDFDVLLDSGITPPDVKGKNVGSFSVQNISYNPVTERFTADIFAFDDKLTVIGQIAVAGSAAKMITVPVLRSRTKGGTVITEADLTGLRVRQSELADGIRLTPEEITGMAPRRTLPSMTPLDAADLMLPRIVKKNDVITVSMNKGPLSLTAKGRALSDGAKGDIISVLNLSGKKVIEAVVVSAGNAAIPTSDTN